MKKIRFSQVFNVCVYNVGLSECRIMNLIDSFESGKISAAACRRLFLDLWRAFVIDVKRYNSVLLAWREYDSESLKNSNFRGCKYINQNEITAKYYDYFMN